MSIRDRIKAGWEILWNGLPSESKQAAGQIPLIWPSWRKGTPQWQIVDLASYISEGFDLNTLIYSAIMYKVRALRSAPLRAYTGDVDQPERLPSDDPLSKVVARPNMGQSWMTFHGQNIVYLNISGNAYIWMIRPRGGGTPEQMYSLRPDRVYIIPKPDTKTIIGYLYVPEGAAAWGQWDTFQRQRALIEGQAIPILPQDMCHVKLPNPGDPLDGMGYGLSPLAPLAQSADVDNNVTHFLKKFFESGAMITGLLKFDVPMDEGTVAQARERWKEIYGGVDNWDVAVLDQGGSYQRVGMTFQEMGFESLDDRNESRILGPLGVPGILIGTRLGLNRAINANAKELRAMCWQDTLLPENALFEDNLQYFLQTDAGGFVAFDYSKVDALKKDLAPLVDSYSKLWSTGVPANLAARTVGLGIENIPGGDTGYLPLSVIPIITEPGRAAQTQQGAPEAEQQAEQQQGKASTGKALTVIDHEREVMVRQFEQAMIEFRVAMESNEDGDDVDKAALNLLFEIKAMLSAGQQRALPQQQTVNDEDVNRAAILMLAEIKGMLASGGSLGGGQQRVLSGSGPNVPNIFVQVEPTPFTIENKQESQFMPAPVVNVNVSPTPITNEVSVSPTPVTVDSIVNVSPTPVTVENAVNVEPTPVTVENTNNVFPPSQPVTLQVANTTSVVRRDSAGRIAEIENKPEVTVNG